MKHIKSTIKLSLLASAILMASSVSSVELAQLGNSIVFDALDNTQYSVKIRSPEGEVYTFQSNNGDFTLTAKMLGLETLGNGQYKYEMTPVFTAGTISKEVRDLNDETVTANYLKSLKTNAQPLSGVFTISNDFLVDRNLVDPNTVLAKGSTVNDSDVVTRDQVFLDDIIVDGSACIGFDCVNGESFGFDTIRLKENNLRIRAVDTSSSASFPTRDWQITFNDSSNGGLNKFSIDDIDGGRTPFTIEAGAPSNTLYVESDGDVGIKTSNPVVDIHVVEGNTPTLRLEQDGSDGFTPQTWDIAGNEANFFIRDATNGSTLPFKIRPSAPTGALVVEADGDVTMTKKLGIGTTSPQTDIHILDSSTDASIRFDQTSASGNTWDMGGSSTGTFFIQDIVGDTKPVKIFKAAATNLFKLGQTTADTVTVTGNLEVSGTIKVGSTVVHPDYVFRSDYNLKTIEEHAGLMWNNNHLPAIKSADEINKNKGYNLTNFNASVLEELEVAHIYIDQLNNKLKNQDEQFSALQKRLAKLEQSTLTSKK